MQSLAKRHGIDTIKWKAHKNDLSKIKRYLSDNECEFIDAVLSIDKGIGMNTFITFIHLYDKAKNAHFHGSFL